MTVILANSAGWVGMVEAVWAASAGAGPLDVIERAVRVVEASPEVTTVGYGGWPNLSCEVELDASIMDGDSLQAGAVGALKGFLHPITVARQVMERLPNVLLVGEGAARFARECGHPGATLLSDEARARWLERVYNRLAPEERARWPQVPLVSQSHLCLDPELEKGTTAFLVRGETGSLASGVSTSGLAWKYPGRLGDSPLIGAGNYADSRYGAAACVGAGEMTIRAGTARAVVLYLKSGMTVREACLEALADLRSLKGGLSGGVSILAMDRNGGPFVLSIGDGAVARYCFWTSAMRAPEQRAAAVVAL